MFKSLKNTNHEVDLNVNVDASRFFKAFTSTALKTAVIYVAANVVISAVDSKLNHN